MKKNNLLLRLVRLFILGLFFLFQSNLSYSQTCTQGAFNWDDGNGNGQVFPFDSQSESYTLNAGGALGITLEIIDPDNLNADSNYYVAGNHPFDPLGGCNPNGNQNDQVGPLINQSIRCGEVSSNVPGSGSIYDPWDSDCSLDPTQTNGVYGLNYFTIWMRSENSDQEVEYRFTFDRPTNIIDFRISDIDAAGFYCCDACDLENIGNSFQDEVRMGATDLCGDDVALSVQSTTAQPASNQIINGQSSYSEYNPNQNSNVAPTDQNGEIIVNSTKPVTTFSIFYSNGPDDKAWEEANAAAYPWWSNNNGALSGVSDDHAIRIDGFDFCACPNANIVVTGSACEGAPVTYTVSADYFIDELIVDGVTQPNTTSFTITSATTTSYEVVVVGVDDCKESITFNAVADPIPSAPSISVTDNDCSTLTSGLFNVVSDCGLGSTIEWSINNGSTWSSTIPNYDPVNPVTVLARCIDEITGCASLSSSVTSSPTICCEEVSGVAFLDANNDGCQSGPEEVGVEGMEASIFECDAAGMPTGVALATVPTAADGSYAFGPDETGAGMVCLDPAVPYTVSFSFPADGSLDNLNYSTGDPAGAGACDGTDSADDSAANDGTTACVDPSSDTDDEHIDIGLYPCGELGGIVFIDDNNDGCQAGAEDVGIAGMEVSLFECDALGNPSGAALITTVSGVDGSYAFGPDESGSSMICLDPAIMYTVSFAFPANGSLDGYFFSTGDPSVAGCDGSDSSDDSAANDGTVGCFDPADPMTGDDGDEHIDLGIYPCLVKSDVIASGSGSNCLVEGGDPVYRNIITDDSEILPPGYQIVYILVDESDNIVVFNIESFFNVLVSGNFMAYSVAYDPNDYDVLTALTLTDVLTNLTCFDISDPEMIEVEDCCLAYAGFLTDAAVDGCASEDDSTVATLTAVQNGGTVPAGFTHVYLLTDASTNIIVATSAAPSFQMTSVGSYIMHPFVYDPSEFDLSTIDLGVTNIFDFNISIFSAAICYGLHIPGVDLQVYDCCAQDLYIPGVGVSVPTDHYERDGIISSDGLINNSPTDFDSGTEILMMPGFEVVLGVEFHAYIDGCN